MERRLSPPVPSLCPVRVAAEVCSLACGVPVFSAIDPSFTFKVECSSPALLKGQAYDPHLAILRVTSPKATLIGSGQAYDPDLVNESISFKATMIGSGEAYDPKLANQSVSSLATSGMANGHLLHEYQGST